MRKMSAKNGAYNLSVHTKRHTNTKHAHTQQVLVGLAVLCSACELQSGGMAMGGCACCLVIPLVVINIMMWVFMFKSDKECGSSLWGYGIALLVFGCIHSGSSNALQPKPQR